MVVLDCLQVGEAGGFLRLIQCFFGALQTCGALRVRVLLACAAEGAQEHVVRVDGCQVLQGDGLGVALTVSVLRLGALEAQVVEYLTGGQFLENQGGAVACPADDGEGLVAVLGGELVLQRSGTCLVCLDDFFALVDHVHGVSNVAEVDAPVATRVAAVDDGSDLLEGFEGLGALVYAGGVDQNQVGIKVANLLVVDLGDGADNLHALGAVGKVVGHAGLAATGDGTDGGHAEGEQAVEGGLREDDNLLRVGGDFYILLVNVLDGAGTAVAAGGGTAGSGGRGGLAAACREGESSRGGERQAEECAAVNARCAVVFGVGQLGSVERHSSP